jgi:probable rRNA maturation factor
LGCEGREVSILIVDDAEITSLNRQHFHRNRPTNVISFPLSMVGPSVLQPEILGDVVISAETAQRQAKKVGEKTEEEILFLMIHGILHLLGYNHEGLPAQRREMEAKERELFSLLMHPSRRP